MALQDFQENIKQRIAVSPQEAAQLVGFGRTTLYAAMKKGVLKTSKIGTRRLILLDSLKDWIASYEVPFVKG